MAPALSPTPRLSPIPPHMRLESHQHLNLSRCQQVLPPLTLNLPLSISKPNYYVVIASSSVSMTPYIPSTSFCPTLWTTSLTFHPTPLAPKQVTKTDWGDLEPLKQLAALKSDWMGCILLDCTIISLFVTSSARFHDTHPTHLRLPQGKRSVVDQIDQDPSVLSSAVWTTV